MRANFVLILLIMVNTMLDKKVECAKKMDIDELTNFIKPMSKSCKTKTGVSEELLAATKQGEFRREKSLMCYFKCLSVMLKLMNKQGEVNLASVETQINLLIKEEVAPRLIAIGKLCHEKVPPNEDKCEYAFDIVVCGYNEDHTLYFLPI